MELNDKTVKIKVEKLRKCFGDLEVLRDISTEIHEGEGDRPVPVNLPSCAA